MGPILLKLNENATVYVPAAQVAPAGLSTDVAALGNKRQSVAGVQSKDDTASSTSGTRPPGRRPHQQVPGG